MTIYGVDTSHHNALGDFPAMKRSGLCDYLFAKATEGVGFTDPQYARSRAGAKAAGIIFGAYHFARPGDPRAQADYFLSVAKPAAGEITVLDMEDTAIGATTAAWSAVWCARVKAATGKPPLIYLNSWFLGAYDWRPVLALDCGLWLAKYDNSPTGGPTGAWPWFAVKQFTDHGTIPGQPGEVDRNASPLTVDQLRSYAIEKPTPRPVPQPAPTPTGTKEQGMVLIRKASTGAVYLIIGEKRVAVPGSGDLGELQKSIETVNVSDELWTRIVAATS